jgi:hypothetical protein
MFMRFLIEVRTPVEVGNAGMRDGTLPTQIRQYLNDIKPEAAYFSAAHGQRTIYLIVDIQSPSQLAEIAEPAWLDWRADVYFTPVATAEEFAQAGASIEKIVQARK